MTGIYRAGAATRSLIPTLAVCICTGGIAHADFIEYQFNIKAMLIGAYHPVLV